MDAAEILEQLKGIMVERLKFDPRRATGLGPATTLPKGVDGSLELDSLDFIELSLGIEDCFGIVMDERDDLAVHFQTLGTLVDYIKSRIGVE
jgi:acyl carrier protein